MEGVSPRWCGLDVQKKMGVACVIVLKSVGQRRKERRTFRTTTQELLLLRDGLVRAGCTHLAMEATGVSWKPVSNVLDGAVERLVVNARQSTAVPGRKTDVRDAEGMADVFQHGLLTSRFLPPAAQRAWRERTRSRTNLGEERARAVNRVQKTLEETNITRGDVATEIMGTSARAMVEALLDGQTDPAILADLVRGRLTAKRAQWQEALVGTLKPHHRFMLTEHRALRAPLDQAITRASKESEARMGPPDPETQGSVQAAPEEHHEHKEKPPLPWDEAVRLLDRLPGINPRAAQGMLAESGTERSRFPSARPLASWAGMCPGTQESGGKRLSGKTRKGIRTLLVETAHAAAHTKNTSVSAPDRRIASRRGATIALLAGGHSLLVRISHMLCEHVSSTA